MRRMNFVGSGFIETWTIGEPKIGYPAFVAGSMFGGPWKVTGIRYDMREGLGRGWVRVVSLIR